MINLIDEENLDLFNKQVKGNFYTYFMYTSILEKKPLKIIWFIILFWDFQQQWQQQKERFKTARHLGI